jgi:hypothetical protein
METRSPLSDAAAQAVLRALMGDEMATRFIVRDSIFYQNLSHEVEGFAHNLQIARRYGATWTPAHERQNLIGYVRPVIDRIARPGMDLHRAASRAKRDLAITIFVDAVLHRADGVQLEADALTLDGLVAEYEAQKGLSA